MLETIGQRIRERRKELHMTQVQLAEKSKVSRMIISHLENGKMDNCLVSTLTSIANALGANVNIFFG